MKMTINKLIASDMIKIIICFLPKNQRLINLNHKCMV